MLRRPWRVVPFIFVAFTCACQSGPPANPPADRSAPPGAETSAPTAGPADPALARPLAYVDGAPVRADDLVPALLEAAGGTVLAEQVLDRRLADALSARGLAVSPDQLDAERQFMLETLAEDENEAARLLRELRQRRGLGDYRFDALLWRNAALRMLVQDDVQVTDVALAQAYDLTYGPRYRARLIVVDRAQDAGRLRQRVLAGESFSDLAAEYSTDASAAQGGLLPPINPADPTYPQVVRETLLAMDRQDQPISDVIALDGQYALLALERKIGAEPVEFDDVKEDLARQVRRRLERIQMQQLARRLLDEANVVVLDPALGDSWRQQRQEIAVER